MLRSGEPGARGASRSAHKHRTIWTDWQHSFVYQRCRTRPIGWDAHAELSGDALTHLGTTQCISSVWAQPCSTTLAVRNTVSRGRALSSSGAMSLCHQDQGARAFRPVPSCRRRVGVHTLPALAVPPRSVRQRRQTGPMAVQSVCRGYRYKSRSYVRVLRALRSHLVRRVPCPWSGSSGRVALA
jgi:hypothetical protein